MYCPCKSGKKYANCCENYIELNLPAPNAEALMRSRYTAYTQANIDYIIKTMRPPASNGYNAERAKDWAVQATWLGLQVLRTKNHAQDPNIAWVEFIAHYKLIDHLQNIHEISEFKCIDGSWYYVNGHKAAQVKVGRNDLCPCGSGKKYKKCCGK